jgi:hypothetical protein
MTTVVSVSTGPQGEQSINEMATAGVSAGGVSSGGVVRAEVGGTPQGGSEGNPESIAASAHNGRGGRVYPGNIKPNDFVRVGNMDVTVEVAMQTGLLPATFLKDQGVALQGSPQQPQQQNSEEYEAAVRQQQEDAQARLPGDGEETFHDLHEALGEDVLVTVGADVVMSMVYPDASSTLSPDDLAEVARGRGLPDVSSAEIGTAMTKVLGGIADKAHSAVAGVFSLRPTEEDLSPVYDLMRKDPDRMRDALMHLFLQRSTSKLIDYAKQIKSTLRVDENGNAAFDRTVIVR